MIRNTIKNYLETQPNRIVIKEIDGKYYTLDQLKSDIETFSLKLKSIVGNCSGKVFGVAMRSSYEWIYTMLAIHRIEGILLPVPIEFSDEQIKSLMGKSTMVFVDSPEGKERINKIIPDMPCLISDQVITDLNVSLDVYSNETISTDIVSIIHTSGTTSNPKGVLIRDEAVDILVKNVIDKLPNQPLHYLSIVPMSLLIEQVLGVYIPILTNGSITIMPKSYKEYGSASGNAKDYLDLIRKSDINFLYLPPKLIEEIDESLINSELIEIFGKNRPHIITGGAKVSENVLQRLENKGVSVFEAYGLSENSSIISLNSPSERRIGSAGKLLKGIVPKFHNGELLVKTPTLCAGYYNADDTSCDLTDGYLHTGDIAHIEDGFLYITGRKKHVIILSTARNISPEWVEGIYKESPLLDDIIVLGEGQQELGAVILTSSDKSLIKGELHKYDKNLAGFARVNKFVVINDIQDFRNKFYTVTGRPKRKEIELAFISKIYS